MTQTAIEAPWRYEIQYGPEGEANFAWVYHGKEMVCTARTHHAKAIVTALSALHAKAGVSVEGDDDDYIIPDGQIIGELRALEKGFIADKQLTAAAVCKDAATRLSALSTKLQEPVEEPKRWLVEETLPSGSFRWGMFEHEYQARKSVEACAHPAVATPLYTLAHQPVTASWEKALEALEPFVQVLEHDISVDETDSEIFQPMRENHRAPLLTIADFRRAASALAALKSEGRNDG